MKKICLLILPILFLIPHLSFAITSDLPSPQQPYQGVVFTCNLGGETIIVYNAVADLVGSQDCGSSQTSSFNTHKFFVEWSDGLQPPPSTVSEARLSPYYLGDINFYWRTPTTVSSIISNASSSIDQAFGFGFENGVSYMKVQLLSILGSFLMLLEGIIGFVIAIIVIFTIVVLIYRGFRYFKH